MTDFLFSAGKLGKLTLPNRIVMAPMTRSRAIGNVPNDLMAKYYADRADAGLIVTEGVAPSADGLGYSRIPGLFTDEQQAGWKKVTDAVHAKGGRIVVQFMHTGRIGHPDNMLAGARMVAPSAVAAAGQMWTDQKGLQDHPVPVEMTEADIAKAIGEFVDASKRAIAAGFDGVELHGANGYLIDQFLNMKSNRRTDRWGGSVENRIRFAVEAAKAVAAAIGPERVGIRLSPYGVYNDLGPDAEMDAVYLALLRELNAVGIAFVHFVDVGVMGAPESKPVLRKAMREAFDGAFILNGGYDGAKAEADLAASAGDFVAFGKPFISNPDLVAKLKSGAALRPADPATFFTPGAQGYSDYPVGLAA
ncbi:MAG: alkene reductase [Betaproteobacteria bacterium]|nr:alkene reductase [Betaproteobacteria bacterium]